jgi:phosphate-selective porin OprO and OprP
MKKALIIVAGLFLILQSGQTLFAKTLADVLKEKGVVTQDDLKSIDNGSQYNYKPGEGFIFTSPDEKFQGSIGGSLQLRYTFMDLDDANNTAAKHAQDYSKFELRRIKLSLAGYTYTKDLAYRLQINFSNISGGAVSNGGGLLEETWANYRLRDEVQFRFGQDKIQFGREFITSTTAQQFVDQSVATTAFAAGYDTGFMISGKIANGLFNYNAGVYGGLGQNTYRATNDNAFTARIAVNPFGDMKYSESDAEQSQKPLLSIGADYYMNTINASEQNTAAATNNQLSFNSKNKGWFAIGNPLSQAAAQIGSTEAVDYKTSSLDAAFKWRGASFQGEYFMARAEGNVTGNKIRAMGYYAQAGYFVIPGILEVAARHSYIDPNRDVSGDHWSENTAAVSWFINRHNLKLQTDFTGIHKQPLIASTSGVNSTNDKQVRTQVQLLF